MQHLVELEAECNILLNWMFFSRRMNLADIRSDLDGVFWLRY